MAYLKNRYPQFKDIKFFTAVGIDAAAKMDSVVAFLEDPANQNFRIINVCENFVPLHARILSESENRDFWTNITILYTE